MTDETTTTKKAGLSPIEVGAGAGAAVITALATSYLGTAGTLTGAALASVVATVSTSVLRSSAENSAQRLKHTTTRLRDTGVRRADATDIRPVESEDVDPYGTQLFHASNWIDPEPGGGPLDPGVRTQRPGTGTPGSETSRGPLDPSDQTRHLRAGAAGSETSRGPLDPSDRTRQPGAGDFGSVSGGEDATERFRTGTDLRGPGGLAGAAGSDPGSAWGTATDHLAANGHDADTDRRPPTHPYGPETGPTEPFQTRPLGTGHGPIGAGPAGTGAETDATGSGRPAAGTGGAAEVGGPAAAPGKGQRGRWVVLGAGAVAAFALALGAITGIEAVAGKPLSGLTGQESGGGTTLGRATGGDKSSGSRPTPTPTPTTTGGATATEPAPSTGTSPSGGVSATSPSRPPATSDNPAPSPTQPAPTRAPSPSPNPLTSQTP